MDVREPLSNLHEVESRSMRGTRSIKERLFHAVGPMVVWCTAKLGDRRAWNTPIPWISSRRTSWQTKSVMIRVRTCDLEPSASSAGALAGSYARVGEYIALKGRVKLGVETPKP